jgi:O6-methylguanine-DNA--protein-cysteine methyltransferase
MKDIDVKLTSLGLSESDAISQEGENLKQSYKDLFAQIRDILINEFKYTTSQVDLIVNSSLKNISRKIDEYVGKQQELLAKTKIKEAKETSVEYRAKSESFKIEYGDSKSVKDLQNRLKKDVGGQFSLNTFDVDLNTKLFDIAEKYSKTRKALEDLIEKFPELGEALQQAQMAEIKYAQDTTLTNAMEKRLAKVQATFEAFHDIFSTIGEQIGQGLADGIENGFDFGAFFANLAKMMRAMAIQKTVSLIFEGTYQQIMATIYRTLAISNALANPALAAAYWQASIGAQVASSGAFAGAAVMGSLAGGLIAGMAHDGMKSIPEDGTWLLQKGERVVDRQTNKDLTNFIQNASGAPQVNMTVNINGGDAESVEKATPELKRTIRRLFQEELSNNGQMRKMMYSR